MSTNLKILEIFSELRDHRVNRTKLHSMENIIFITMAAVICGAETWNEIEEYGKHKQKWLSTFLDMPNGVPSHDTFNRFFSGMNPENFENCFRKWVQSIVKTIKDDIVSIDGKTICGNRTLEESPLHVVSAWSNRHGLSLGQLKTFDKSNEITIIPELLDSLELSDSVVTIDAMGCQEKIAEKIISKNADYILAVKKNHPGLHEGIIDSFRFITPTSIDINEDFGHGRIEKRTCSMITDLSMIHGINKWKGVKSIVRVESERIIKNTGEIQPSIRYYITSLETDVENIANSIRSHWGIENSLHWMLDVAFSEDSGRKKNKNAALNFSIVSKIALTIIKKDTETKVGVKSRRKIAAWDDDYLLGLMKIE
ncbi:MAG: ISAs1 family transposase [Bacteroidota bacterium]